MLGNACRKLHPRPGVQAAPGRCPAGRAPERPGWGPVTEHPEAGAQRQGRDFERGVGRGTVSKDTCCRLLTQDNEVALTDLDLRERRRLARSAATSVGRSRGSPPRTPRGGRLASSLRLGGARWLGTRCSEMLGARTWRPAPHAVHLRRLGRPPPWVVLTGVGVSGVPASAVRSVPQTAAVPPPLSLSSLRLAAPPLPAPDSGLAGRPPARGRAAPAAADWAQRVREPRSDWTEGMGWAGPPGASLPWPRFPPHLRPARH